MFDGVPEQFHQFITPRTSLPLHLPFPLHASANPNTTFPSNFDPYNPHHHQLPLQPTTLLHPLHHPPHPTHKDEQHKEQNTAVALPMNFQIQRDQRHLIHPWTNDEVLSLLRIRSSMESWFPELTWEHVSRYLLFLLFSIHNSLTNQPNQFFNRKFN